MDEDKIRSIAQSVFDENSGANQFAVSQTPYHTHNGSDSQRINQKNIIPNTRALGSITMAHTATNYAFGITFNPVRVLLYGNAIRTAYTFTVTAANATIGAVYSNSTFSFGVVSTLAGGTTLLTQGANHLPPAASGTLTKVSGTGDATITYSSVVKYINTRANIMGSAILGPGYNFQPQTTSSVTYGPLQSITQGSAMFLIDSFHADTTHDGTTPPMTVRAIADESHIVETEYAADTFALAGGVVARATITSLNATSLTVLTSLAVGWEINATYVIE